MGARAEVMLASAPVLELRLGRAQHHPVVPRSPVAPAVSAILAGAKSDFMSSDWPGQPRATAWETVSRASHSAQLWLSSGAAARIRGRW